MREFIQKDNQEIELRLQEIEIEKENIKKIYDYYFESEEKFTSDKIMNTLVILSRRNHQLMERINLEKRNFLNTCRIINHKYISALNEWLAGNPEVYPLLICEERFSLFENQVSELIKEKEANDLLLCEINNLLDEEKALLRQKKANEKRQKKRLLFKPKNAKIE